MDMNSENWELTTLLPDFDEELKKMRKNLRLRNWKIVLTSVVLVIAVLFASVQFGIPALESLYWDPNASTYIEGVSDLELTMVTYNELFGHGQYLFSLDITKNGFASYAIETSFLEWETMNSLSNLTHRETASLTRSELSIPSYFWRDITPGIFPRKSTESDSLWELRNEETKQKLSALPEYIQVLASISFPNDLSMKQLNSLTHQFDYDEARFLWAVLRSSDPSERNRHSCGIHLMDYRSERYEPEAWKDTAYPNLFTDRLNWSAKSMEQHVISMLQFSADQVKNGTGILPEGADPDYYQNVLGYMEENGVKAYGCYVITTPQTLLNMMEKGTVSHVYLTDAWIGI